jgi:hypothetical protein
MSSWSVNCQPATLEPWPAVRRSGSSRSMPWRKMLAYLTGTQRDFVGAFTSLTRLTRVAAICGCGEGNADLTSRGWDGPGSWRATPLVLRAL